MVLVIWARNYMCVERDAQQYSSNARRTARALPVLPLHGRAIDSRLPLRNWLRGLRLFRPRPEAQGEKACVPVLCACSQFGSAIAEQFTCRRRASGEKRSASGPRLFRPACEWGRDEGPRRPCAEPRWPYAAPAGRAEASRRPVGCWRRFPEAKSRPREAP